MTALYHLNENIAHLLEGFLESAVPLIAGLAEVIGLFIIVTSLVKATYHYVRATFFRDRYDFHHEMSTGLTTALEFLMSAEIAKTFLLQNLESVIPLAATFALRALMSLLSSTTASTTPGCTKCPSVQSFPSSTSSRAPSTIWASPA